MKTVQLASRNGIKLEVNSKIRRTSYQLIGLKLVQWRRRRRRTSNGKKRRLEYERIHSESHFPVTRNRTRLKEQGEVKDGRKAIKWRWMSESEDPPPCVSLKFLPIPWIWGGGDWLRGIESHLHSVTLFQWLSTSRERPYREMEALGVLPDDFKAAEDRKWKRRGWFPETTSYVS